MDYVQIIKQSERLVKRIRGKRGYKNYTKNDMIRTQANFERVEIPARPDHGAKYALLKRMAQRLGAAPKANKSYRDSKTFTRWRLVRYEALKRSNGACECCGATSPLHVDHIKPKSLFPDLEFVLDNLQVLCADCNIGKGNWDETNWREMRKKTPPTFEERMLALLEDVDATG